ncbi:dTDP-4-dehydrorhamnose reductase [Mesoterricola silvestris]|uniref:dTDP-4-dehydrorhamnose reductase n=1 Tax=Mesoterricola silvestris TaxID=2927979 RepID=A0AA48GVH3_9BACT|nr:dTDP-4-dehydrorhamnose reductase [Mesoterricola silvestris]BDU71083.1 NAD(P)-dependent oxidoreductase [Mesoterricola silvestris]
MKVLLTGASGQLAQAVLRTWQAHELLGPDETSLDLADRDSIRAAMATFRPDAVLNLGAFTQVDRCEAEEERATLVNGTAVGWLAEACAAQGTVLVQISTDYVFDGQGARPYREEDPASPLSAYGRSKLLGEAMARLAPRHLIARTSWLYDHQGRNFFTTMLDKAARGEPIRVVDDQRGAPTSCGALALQLEAALTGGWQGLVHMTCQGETTWHGFAVEIFRQMGVEADLRPCLTAEFKTAARRPAYSVLCGDKRRLLGRDLMPPWQEALAQVASVRKGERP